MMYGEVRVDGGKLVPVMWDYIDDDTITCTDAKGHTFYTSKSRVTACHWSVLLKGVLH